MKKTISILLAVAMLMVFLPISADAVASDGNQCARFYAKEFHGIVCQFSETVMDNQQIVRTYKNSAESSRSVSKNAKNAETARMILLELGMDAKHIAQLSDADVINEISCEEITVIISHIRTTESGEATYISEAEMQAATSRSSERPEDILDATYADEYMSILHTVYYYGNGRYRFKTFARWRTMPFWRLTDSLGSCAQNISILYGTEYGEYGCDYHFISPPGDTEVDSRSYEMTDIHQAQPYGVWDGMAGTFNLPNDWILAGEESTQIHNFYAFVEFEALVSDPTHISNFNTVGCYCHMMVQLDINPVASIGYKESTFGIGIGFSATSELRTAGMVVKYYP